jgi:fructose-1,6-bisphosphatase/inositol monophosphatase family enzyme
VSDVPLDDDALLEVLHETADAVRHALDGVTDWGLSGLRETQYHCDVAADAAALAVLERAGVGVLSEESGLHRADRTVVVVIDPVDGSTNASHGLPWFATSMCAVDADGPRVAVVVNQASGERFEAVRGGGARSGGRTLQASSCTTLADALVGLSGWPDRHLGWRQYRALGAAALDLCAVAAGRLDAYADIGSIHGPWDYLGGMLICQEAGAVVADGEGRELVVVDHAARRAPVAAADPALLAELLDARAGLGGGG